MFKMFNILQFIVWSSYLLHSNYAARHPVSPCPNVFSFEGEQENDRWSGVIYFSSNIELAGLTYKIQLDRPAQLLVSWDGEVRTDDNTLFHVNNQYRIQKPGEMGKAQIMVKFDPTFGPPGIVKIVINGNTVCSQNMGTSSGGVGRVPSVGLSIDATERIDPVFNENEDKRPDFPSYGNKNSNTNFGNSNPVNPNRIPTGGSNYGNPNQQNFGNSNPSSGTSNNPVYSGSNQGNYGSPNEQSYGSSNQPNYGTPNQQNYGSPNQLSYGSSNQPSYGSPNQPNYGSPNNQQGYGAPNPLNYGSPNQPNYYPANQPVQSGINYNGGNRPQYQDNTNYNNPNQPVNWSNNGVASNPVNGYNNPQPNTPYNGTIFSANNPDQISQILNILRSPNASSSAIVVAILPVSTSTESTVTPNEVPLTTELTQKYKTTFSTSTLSPTTSTNSSTLNNRSRTNTTTKSNISSRN